MRLFSFSGSISRKQYFQYLAINFGLALLIFAFVGYQKAQVIPNTPVTLAGYTVAIVFLGIIGHGSAIARRLRDIGQNSWLTVIIFLTMIFAPLYFIILILLGCIKSKAA
jgi:uncharacterized membrane protein YhaH (DUF805 family)